MASKSFDNLIDQIGNLSVLELSELVKALEEKFGVSAAAPAVAAAPAASSEAGAKEDEKTEFKVELEGVTADDRKIAVIKALRVAIPSLQLMDAKKAVEGAPSEIAAAVSKDEAQKIKKLLEEAGGKVKVS